MANKTPQESEFKKAEKCKNICGNCRYIILAISLLQIGLDLKNFDSDFIMNAVAIILLLVTVFHMFIKNRYSQHFRKAEDERRKGFFDKSFGTKMASIDSKGYYDTDDIDDGYKKFLANLHENCLYSSKISEEMLNKVQGKSVCIFLAFVLLTVANIFKVQTTIALINILMVADVIGAYNSLKYYQSKTQEVFDDCIDIWKRLDNCCSENIDSKIIAEIIKAHTKYETTLAYESIMLDSKVYRALNGPLMEEWVKLEERYNMTK